LEVKTNLKKSSFAFITIAATIIGLAISYPIGQLLVIPSTAFVPAATVDIYIDEVLWENGTELAWGTVYPGETTFCNLTVQNTGDTNATVIVTCPDLPVGWTLTWTENNTLLNVTQVLEGDLDLTVPYDAVPGSYSWTTYVLAEQT